MVSRVESVDPALNVNVGGKSCRQKLDDMLCDSHVTTFQNINIFEIHQDIDALSKHFVDVSL